MKKIIYSAMAVAMLATTSCKDDFAESFVGEEATVEFSISTPEIGTRAYSDGTKATHLQYAVYEANDAETLTQVTGELTNFDGNETISLTLKTGKDYKVVFWAAAPNAPYTVDFASKTMTVDYSDAKTFSNDESRDAFYAVATVNTSATHPHSVELKRPFAQLNIGTNDYAEAAAANYEPKYSKVVVKQLKNQLNLLTGAVEGTAADITFGYSVIPNKQDETFPVAGYEYLAMNYLLVPADQEVVDVTFYHNTDGTSDIAENTKTVGSVPVRRNYRTNLYGKLLTSNADINVEINPDYGGEENKEIVEVATATQLQEAIESGGNGETIILTDNIELTEPLVFSVNSSTPAPTRSGATNSFVLNLNGKTIEGTDTGTASYGLITITKGADLTIEGNGTISLIATQNRGWNAYSSVISNQQGKLTVNGGTIEHFGGTDMAYAIDNLTNGKGTYAETIINGGTIKSTYRAIRQFLNATDAQNILTVNGGTIESTGRNKSIWMQGANTNANSGTLKVYGKATINSDIYIDMPEGTTDWDVEAYIEKAALKNGSTIITENIPEGCVTVAVSNADQLVEALQNGYNVYFLNDITVAATKGGYNKAGILQNKAQTIDGGGYTLTVTGAGATWDCAIYTNGGVIKNLTVAGAMRGIFTAGANADLTIDNVVFQDVIYTFNSDAGNVNYGVYISNSTLNGWTSHSDVHKEVVYTNCYFGEGNGYAFCRPYGKTSFVGCNFCEGYAVDPRAAVTFENCTINCVALTEENLATLVTSNTANATVK